MINIYEYIFSENILLYLNMVDKLYIVLNIGKYICMYVILVKFIYLSYFFCSVKIRFLS